VIQSLKDGILSILDTQLSSLYAGQSADVAAMSILTSGVETLPGSIHGSGQFVTIDATAKDGNGATLLTGLAAIGLQQGGSFGNMASGILPVEQIGALLTVSDLSFARESGSGFSAGSVTNQADHAILADTARSTFAVDGNGIAVGVLSDSFNDLVGMNADITSGDLPANTTILSDLTAGGTDEGRGMAQIVHDIAPGASILFATAFTGLANFANNIIALASAGAKVIVDDVSYFAETAFQDGPVSQAIDQVTANGVVYFSAAANDADKGFEAAFVRSGVIGPFDEPLAKLTTGADSQFLPVTIPRNVTVNFVLQWNQPAQSVSGGAGAQSDVDLFLYNSGGAVVSQSISDNIGHDPVEIISFTNKGATATFDLAVGLFSGVAPTDFKLTARDDGAGVVLGTSSLNTNAGTIYGHAAAENAIAVAAADYSDTPAFGLSPPIVERFSSGGPTRILFDAAGNALATPEIRQTPEITAVDGGDTTFFGSDTDGDGFPNFFGTSAAAPSAAAVAALMLQANGALTYSDVLNLLEDSAIDMDDPATAGFDSGFDNRTGAGLIQADKAVEYASTQTVTGDTNDNVLLGTHLADVLNGLAGNDTLIGGAGLDTLTGGGGSDKFVIDAAALTDALAGTPMFDVITDYDQGNTGHFSASEKDKIDTSGIVQTAFVGGQSASALVHVFDNGDHGTFLMVDADGTANGTNYVPIAQLDGIHAGDTVNAILQSNKVGGVILGVESDQGYAGNFNGGVDGISDLVWVDAANNAIRLYELNGAASGNQVLASLPSSRVLAGFHVDGIGDFNGDGNSDLLLANDSGALRFYEMDGNSLLANVRANRLPDGFHIAGIGDFNHDGISDAILQNDSTGVVNVWEFNGVSSGSQVLHNLRVGTLPAGRNIVGTGDFDGDGNADIVIRNDGGLGTIQLWETKGTASGVQLLAKANVHSLAFDTHIEGLGDFNGDGNSDMLLVSDSGAVKLWEMDGAVIAHILNVCTLTSTQHVAGTGDFNGDGIDDILIHDDSGVEQAIELNGHASGNQVLATQTITTLSHDWSTANHHFDVV
ncbi:MAG: FG-GAP-like repeat-containing protein, partial [Pseudolabrys sp.]